MKSDIMSISRLRMGTDGEGITTLVGFYGCTLNCRYCINNQCHSDCVRASYSTEELLSVLSKDEPYYLMTGGGVTFGGGEPLLQAEFIHEVCSLIENKWNKTIETSLNVPWENVEVLLDDIDYWFIDIKDFRTEVYKAYTGQENDIVISNLKRLIENIDPHKICVRIPYIPEFNTKEDTLEELSYLRENISAVVSVEIFDYIRCL